MVLDQHRATLDWWLTPLAKMFRGVSPDVFSWLSLLCAALAGVAFWKSSILATGLLLAAWAGVLFNSIFDLMDGKIAKITGKASPRGDYLDHTFDRFSDTLILTGLAFSPWVRIEWALLALIGTLLTSYMGTQAQAIGIGRNYGGLLGRADRMVLLLIVPVVQYVWLNAGWKEIWTPWFDSLLEVMIAYFAIVGTISIMQRWYFGWKAFDKDGQIKP